MRKRVLGIVVLITFFSSLVSTASAGEAHVINVSTAEALRQALSNAKPGQRIVLSAGTYVAPDKQQFDWQGSQRVVYFGGDLSGETISGTKNNPIILESADPSQPAVIKGLSVEGSGYVLWINGEHWIVRNLVIEHGGKGLMMDNASHSQVSNVVIRETGDEGLHLRSGTSNVVIEDITIENTGLVQPGFGEGVYIGSDRNQWKSYAPHCNNNTIRRCTIRGTTAEAFDIKEGVDGTIIEGCEIYGSKISNELFADSFIDIKGTGSRIFANKFYRENNELVTKGIALVNRNNDIVEVSASYNWIYDNIFDMNNPKGVLVHGYKGKENYAWDNQPASGKYKSKQPILYLSDPRTQ